MSDSFRYTFTPSVSKLLARSRSSLWVSTYQAGKLAVFTAVRENRLSLLPRTFDKAMGLAVHPRGIAIGTRYQIWFLRNEPALAPKIEPKGTFGSCFLPRRSHVTGNIDIHEMAWGAGGEDGLWFVNTLYSSLCTLSPDCSFVPRWRPPFITELRKHDRCHLSGLAMDGGLPAYVTAHAETDAPGGWREDHLKREGGIVMEVAGGDIVARGFSMPHSPRIHEGRLWVLDSGNGELTTIDRTTGEKETVARLPGFTRGLAFLGHYAFVGVSRVRESAIFSGVPIAEGPDERRCGIWVVDTVAGEIVGSVEFEETVDEIFDVQILPGIPNPTVIGLEKDTIEKHCIIGAPDAQSPMGPIAS